MPIKAKIILMIRFICVFVLAIWMPKSPENWENLLIDREYDYHIKLESLIYYDKSFQLPHPAISWFIRDNLRRSSRKTETINIPLNLIDS